MNTITLNNVKYIIVGESQTHFLVSLPNGNQRWLVERPSPVVLLEILPQWVAGATALRHGMEVGVVLDVLNTLSHIPMVKIGSAWICTSQLEVRQW